MKVKVLHLSYSDLFGGAAISAYKIHKALLMCSVDSKMLVVKKLTTHKKVFFLESKKLLLLLKIKNY